MSGKSLNVVVVMSDFFAYTLLLHILALYQINFMFACLLALTFVKLRA